MIIAGVLKPRKHDMIMKNTIVKDSGNFNYQRFFDMYLYASMRTSGIITCIEKVTPEFDNEALGSPVWYLHTSFSRQPLMVKHR